jgi:hypothetical protein
VREPCVVAQLVANGCAYPQLAGVGAARDSRFRLVKPSPRRFSVARSRTTRLGEAVGRKGEVAGILRRIGVERSPPERVYDALTTLDGPSGWWVEKMSGERGTGLGGVIGFRFGPARFGPARFGTLVAEPEPGRLGRRVVGRWARSP